ncbi:MAG: phosphoribosylformimino-5-aminoimidazole carboxamide ribotide isomerase [Chitinivibrionales bacterium]|nr:phosphoribosylformimino-5-aminoimidazole carboxamide ribotide isomerase [Chitinivibrionales bacterium]
MKFRPCIDLHHGIVKQIVGNTLRDGDEASLRTNFTSDRPAAYYASLYRRDKLTGGHIIMLGSGNEAAALSALAEFPGGLQIGGGIIPETAKQYIDKGASHVIVSSYFFVEKVLSLDRLSNLEKAVGKERIVLDLSCKRHNDRYMVMIDRWQTMTELELGEQAFSQLSGYCDEFLIHATENEGIQSGIDVTLVELLSKECPMPVTYAGGVRSLADLEQIRLAGRNRVDATIGSSLDIFGGQLSYAGVVEWHRSINKARGGSA